MTAKSRIAILTAGLLGATGLGVSPVLAAAPATDAPTTLTAADTHDSSVAVPFRKRKKKSRRTTVIVVDSDQNGNTGGDGGNGGSGGDGGSCRGDECNAGNGGDGGNGGNGGDGGGNND